MSQTPGPWRAIKRGDYPTGIRVYGFDGQASSVADVELEPDALLISAAPDLLEALLPLVEVAEFIQITVTMPRQRKRAFDEAIAKARAAIAKAEGSNDPKAD